MKLQNYFLAVCILLLAGCLRCIKGYNEPPLVTLPPSPSAPEDSQAGTTLFSITATDNDGPSPITFRAVGDDTNALVTVGNATQVSIHTWKVIVTLKGRLDRDKGSQRISLLFEISDGDIPLTYTVILSISDVNDNPPAFQNEPYRTEIFEGDELVGKVVYTAVAKDPDNGPGGTPVYFMTANAQGTDNSTFRILNENNGNITLMTALDYETRTYYQYNILSRDRGYPPCPGPGCKCNNFTEPTLNCAGNPAPFVVVVLDVQDTPPFFERLPYMATVLENITIGSLFYQVSAQDGDRGVPNAIAYSINETQYPFHIDATTGELTINSSLNTNAPNGTTRYTITIMASEVITPNQIQLGQTTTTTEMSITVVDMNDQTPTFKQNVYYATVEENTPRRVPLDLNASIEVEDRDQNVNSLFKVVIEQNGMPYPMFEAIPRGEIQGSASVTITVNNSKILDYETTHNISFQLVAQEIGTHEKHSSTATLILYVLDVNDNSPKFTSGPTSVNVTENTANVILGQYTATDADSGPFGTVRYSLESNYSSIFAMDPFNGTMRLLQPLDREDRDSYTLVVIATDNSDADPYEQRSVEYNVRITVLDANDNPPVFNNPFRQASVQENASPGTALMTLTATDKDLDDNAKVFFEIVNIVSASLPDLNCSNFFTIDRATGVLAVSVETKANNDSLLIDNAGIYNVTIAAYDSPHNSSDRCSDTTWVLVTVMDVNIHSPVFVNPDQFLYNATAVTFPNITVKEEIPIGSMIMVLNATDADGGENGIVYYELDPDVDQAFTYFDVNYVNGSLFTKKRLNMEEKPEGFQVNLKAVDRGRPRPLSTTVPFKIVLEDIDDSPPEFPIKSDLKLNVGEETENVSVGYVNISTDKDSNPQHRINCYYIYGGDRASAFQLNKATGELRLNAKLDRDQTSSVTLVVKASGDCTFSEDHFIGTGNNSFNSSDNSQLQVVITVDDINDNGPVFQKDALTVGLLFDAEIGFQVINLVAFTIDNDTAPNRQNFYKLLSRQSDPVWTSSQDPFSVHVNGSVETTTLFSAVDSQVFTLRIMTYDNDNHNDTADLVIYLVSSVVRIRLVFNKQPQEVEALKGEFIRKLTAALGFTVVADKIATHVTTSNTADITKTDMFIHARYIPSGKIVQPVELLSKFDYNLAVREIFREMGVAESSPVVMAETQKDNKDLEKSFIIVAVVLAIVVVVLAMVLFNTVRRYRRRLRAATTSAHVTTKEDMSNNYVPPGTNRYFAAEKVKNGPLRENPLFGKDVKPVDVDQNGDNDSLDDNAVDLTKMGGKEKEEEQEMYVDLYDEGHRGPGSQLNHLQMVLQEYEKGGSEGYDELSTTQSYLTSSLQDGQEWRSLSGHAKADSGFSEQDLHQLDHLQYSDI